MTTTVFPRINGTARINAPPQINAPLNTPPPKKKNIYIYIYFLILPFSGGCRRYKEMFFGKFAFKLKVSQRILDLNLVDASYEKKTDIEVDI